VEMNLSDEAEGEGGPVGPTRDRPALRILSAVRKMRCADRSGIGFSVPSQCWMYPRGYSLPGSPSVSQQMSATLSASTSRNDRF
jgi:hypothetical protein